VAQHPEALKADLFILSDPGFPTPSRSGKRRPRRFPLVTITP
jgi:hypothetical protein